MRHNLSLPAGLVAEVERRAAASRRGADALDLEYGRLFALGLLAKLAEEVSSLFPELTSAPGLPPGGALSREAGEPSTSSSLPARDPQQVGIRGPQ